MAHGVVCVYVQSEARACCSSCELMGVQIALALDEHGQQNCMASDAVSVTDKSADEAELFSQLQTVSHQLDSKLSLLCFAALLLAHFSSYLFTLLLLLLPLIQTVVHAVS